MLDGVLLSAQIRSCLFFHVKVRVFHLKGAHRRSINPVRPPVVEDVEMVVMNTSLAHLLPEFWEHRGNTIGSSNPKLKPKAPDSNPGDAVKSIGQNCRAIGRLWQNTP